MTQRSALANLVTKGTKLSKRESLVVKVGKSVTKRTPRRAQALSDSPSCSLGPERYSKRGHGLGGETRALRRDESENSGEEAVQGRARRPEIELERLKAPREGGEKIAGGWREDCG
jgi:hypothetical protein